MDMQLCFFNNSQWFHKIVTNPEWVTIEPLLISWGLTGLALRPWAWYIVLSLSIYNNFGFLYWRTLHLIGIFDLLTLNSVANGTFPHVWMKFIYHTFFSWRPIMVFLHLRTTDRTSVWYCGGHFGWQTSSRKNRNLTTQHEANGERDAYSQPERSRQSTRHACFRVLRLHRAVDTGSAEEWGLTWGLHRNLGKFASVERWGLTWVGRWVSGR